MKGTFIAVMLLITTVSTAQKITREGNTYYVDGVAYMTTDYVPKKSTKGTFSSPDNKLVYFNLTEYTAEILVYSASDKYDYKKKTIKYFGLEFMGGRGVLYIDKNIEGVLKLIYECGCTLPSGLIDTKRLQEFSKKFTQKDPAESRSAF